MEEVLEIHSDQIRRYGGMDGIANVGLLESAVAQPQSSFGGENLYPDLEAQAAAYLFHLVQNHAFFDGNKRTGAAAAIVFLGLNSRKLTASVDDYEEVVLKVASSELRMEGVMEFFRAKVEVS